MKGERGHVLMFARETPENLAIVERPTARKWCKSECKKFALDVGAVMSNPDYKRVPDCFVTLNGKKISLELTELVDGTMLDRIR
jgi:hypothetical protein